jgi:hypothetical protein
MEHGTSPPVKNMDTKDAIPHPMPFPRKRGKGISSLLSPLGREVGSEGSTRKKIRKQGIHAESRLLNPEV